MQPTLYVAGDVHLRNNDNPFLGFLDLLATRPPSHLVILGDLFDYWLDTQRSVTQFQPVFIKLQLLRQLGWRLDLVLGNRELSAGARLRLACGLQEQQVHWPDYSLRLGDTRIRIVHGDRLCYDPGYHLMAALLRGFWSRAFHLSMPAIIHHALARLGRSLSKGSSQKPSAKRQLNKVFIDPRRVAAHRSHCDLLIAGHIHRLINQNVRGLPFMVVGDWTGNTGNWIEIDSIGCAQMCQKHFSS